MSNSVSKSVMTLDQTRVTFHWSCCCCCCCLYRTFHTFVVVLFVAVIGRMWSCRWCSPSLSKTSPIAISIIVVPLDIVNIDVDVCTFVVSPRPILVRQSPPIKHCYYLNYFYYYYGGCWYYFGWPGSVDCDCFGFRTWCLLQSSIRPDSYLNLVHLEVVQQLWVVVVVTLPPHQQHHFGMMVITFDASESSSIVYDCDSVVHWVNQ